MTASASDRSYYEILCIERDASEEAVRNAYRRLMQTAGHHPDRGGDAHTAAQINKAYAVLRDPIERSAYDARLEILARIALGLTLDTDELQSPATPAAPPDPAQECVFCEVPHDHGIVQDADATCDFCSSPLAAAGILRIEPTGQRAVARFGRRLDVSYFTHWRQAGGYRARTEDLSLNGLRLVTRHHVEQGQRIRLVSELLDAVGNVTHCSPRQGLLTSRTVAGVAFVTLRFTRSVGSFLSRRV